MLSQSARNSFAASPDVEQRIDIAGVQQMKLPTQAILQS